ncbi:MAG: fibrobacter succinogenes major paralogous domain-containing protein [Bacteroidales bacterium]|nr:fibrobacter succinogenes major paralogous domain-containing protein [Bacteroidales bacterium]
MNMRGFIHRGILLALAALVMAAGCKKKQTEPTKGYLEGALSFSYYRYLGTDGQKDTFEVDNKLYHPDFPNHPEQGIKYRWQVTPGMDSAVDATNVKGYGSFSYTYPADTIGSFSVVCTAVPSGNYYSAGVSATVSLVRPGWKADCSLPLETYEASKDSIWSWKGCEYVSTKIGGKHWMRINLAAEEDRNGTPVGTGFLNYEIMRGVFGGYYNWNEAMNACPDGWHLPTDAEWTAMAVAVKPASASDVPQEGKKWLGVAGEMMCYYTFNTVQQCEYQPTVNVTENARMDVKMMGAATGRQYFKYAGRRAFFWTATEAGTGSALCRSFYYDSPDVYVDAMDKASFYASVRCVKD